MVFKTQNQWETTASACCLGNKLLKKAKKQQQNDSDEAVFKLAQAYSDRRPDDWETGDDWTAQASGNDSKWFEQRDESPSQEPAWPSSGVLCTLLITEKPRDVTWRDVTWRDVTYSLG